MTTLDDLIEQRQTIRRQEKELTEQIKQERERIAKEKKENNQITHTGVSLERYRKLEKEKKRIAGLFGLLAKAEDKTYSEIGKMLNVTPSRARQLVEVEKRKLISDDNSA